MLKPLHEVSTREPRTWATAVGAEARYVVGARIPWEARLDGDRPYCSTSFTFEEQPHTVLRTVRVSTSDLTKCNLLAFDSVALRGADVDKPGVDHQPPIMYLIASVIRRSRTLSVELQIFGASSRNFFHAEAALVSSSSFSCSAMLEGVP
jgi:hypothetical protein